MRLSKARNLAGRVDFPKSSKTLATAPVWGQQWSLSLTRGSRVCVQMPAVRKQKAGRLWLCTASVRAKSLISGDVRALLMSVNRTDLSNAQTWKVCAISIHYIQLYCSIPFHIYTYLRVVSHQSSSQNQTKEILVVSTIFFQKQY